MSLDPLGVKRAVKAGAFVFGFVAEPFRRLRQRRIAKRMQSWTEEHGGPPDEVREEFHGEEVTKEVTVFKGKLTYGVLGTLFVALAATVLGDGVITQADADEIGEAVLALVAIYGRWRATRA